MTLIKMPVLGKAELNFWIRAFQLQDEIDDMMEKLREKHERKSAFIPIISEYESGSVRWVFILGACVDPLGIYDGGGTVWLTTGDHHELAALGERNKLADEIIAEAERQGKYDETIMMEPKKDV